MVGYQEQATGINPVGSCSFARRLAELDDDDAAAVLSDMADPHVSSSEVWRKLRLGRTEGETAVGYTIICAHRGEFCACVVL